MGQKVAIPKETFSWDEIQKHNTEASCWVVADGLVFDVTHFLKLHPAGPQSILMRGGQDATRDFRFHSVKSRNMVWMKYCIGSVDKDSSDWACCKSPKAAGSSERSVLDTIIISSKNVGLTAAVAASVHFVPPAGLSA